MAMAMIPVTSSTIGYWTDMAVRQLRHRPRRRVKDKIGISSMKLSVRLQVGQKERGRLNWSVDAWPVSRATRRRLITFRKLPIIAPKIKKISGAGVIR